MQLTRYNTDLGNDTLPSYLPTAAEIAIMAITGRNGQRITRWLEARADNIAVTPSGALRYWVDRAKGVKYIPTTSALPAITRTGTHRRVTFSAPGQSLVAEDASDAFTDPEIYTLAFLSRQSVGGSGGAPFGNGATAAADIAYTWFNPAVSSALAYFSRGEGAASTMNSSVPQNDGVWRVNVISIDVTQTDPALRGQMRCDGANLIVSGGSGPPIALASSAGSRRITIGGAGPQGLTNAFAGSVGAVILIPGVAVHMQASGEYLSLLEAYLSGLKALV